MTNGTSARHTIASTLRPAFAFAAALALIGGAALSSAQVVVNPPNLDVHNVDTSPFTLSQNRPKLVVLLHGVTPNIEEEPDSYISFAYHSQKYWGFHFIQGLMGRLDQSQASMRMITPTTQGTMRYRNVPWQHWGSMVVAKDPKEQAPIYFPLDGLATPPQLELNNQQAIKDYISLRTINQNSYAVMVNTRDGAKHLMPQVADTIDEVYQSYITAYGHIPPARQPQIYIVAHSFGGVIARTILANPTKPDLFGNKLTPLQRAKADYLRKRVVLVKTLSAPHEGTHITDVAMDAADFMETDGLALISAYYSVVQALSWEDYSDQEVKDMIKEAHKTAMDAISGRRDSHEDLLRMAEYNQYLLGPETARRSNNGELVPIYTAAGRNPGNTYYDRSRSMFLSDFKWNPITSLDIASGGRFASNAFALKLIEVIMRTEGYGKAPGAPWGYATMPDGDKIKSPHAGIRPHSSVPRKLSDPLNPTRYSIEQAALSVLEGKPYEEMVGDGQWDNDGFLGWDSANALNLQGRNWYRVINPSWWGPWLPWDNDNHGSLMFNPAIGAWIHNELLRQAGPYCLQAGVKRSQWSASDIIPNSSYSIKMDIKELADQNQSLDNVYGSELSIKARLGATDYTYNGPQNYYTITNPTSFELKNYKSSIIPIRVQATERDMPYDPDDQCTLSPVGAQESLYVYFDTRTGQIIGDIYGAPGSVITARPSLYGVDNPMRMKFTVTQIP